MKTPKLFDRHLGVLYNFVNEGQPPFVSLQPRGRSPTAFNPAIIVGQVPNATFLNGLHYLFHHWPVPFSIGHLLWEDLVSVYTTQRRFRDIDPDVQLIHMDVASMDETYQQFLKQFLPAISSKPMLDMNKHFGAKGPVCFERMLIGGTIATFNVAPADRLLSGREEMFMDFRDLILTSFDVTPSLPPAPVVYITNKSHSVWAKPGRLHRSIANAAELTGFLKESYPGAAVELVEWHAFGLKEQLQMIAHASLIITPCGGVSMTLPFLAEGSHAIIMDYLSDGSHEDVFGYKKGDSASMDISLWNRFPHFSKYYYQIYGLDDIAWDFPGATDMRNDASVKINFTRAKQLVDAAFATMGYEI